MCTRPVIVSFTLFIWTLELEAVVEEEVGNTLAILLFPLLIVDGEVTTAPVVFIPSSMIRIES